MENTGAVGGRRLMIECKNLNKTFDSKAGGHQVVKDLDFAVYENEFVVLFGPGQSGKTTILNILAGLTDYTSGSVVVNGRAVDGPTPHCGMVYQKTLLFPWFSVMKNVDFGPRMAGMPKAERRALAQRYIDLVGLTGFEKHYPIKLSGGMRQRVGIARAYANDPQVILMDEPFGHLDAQTRYMMEEEVERICSQDKRTVVFVTNNVEEAVYLADRIVLLSECPATVKHEYLIDLPRPRNYIAPEFLALRDQITADMGLAEQLTAPEGEE